jgi:hypothetical protein
MKLLLAWVLLLAVHPMYSQQLRYYPPLPVDSFFSDSGLGFDGHYNKCVWVCCSKKIRAGDTIRIVKLCGGMIGAFPESWTLHHWNQPRWKLEYSRAYQHRRSWFPDVVVQSSNITLRKGNKIYKLYPVFGENAAFQRYRVTRIDA